MHLVWTVKHHHQQSQHQTPLQQLLLLQQLPCGGTHQGGALWDPRGHQRSCRSGGEGPHYRGNQPSRAPACEVGVQCITQASVQTSSKGIVEGGGDDILDVLWYGI